MKRLVYLIALLLIAATAATAQPAQNHFFLRSPEGVPVFGSGIRPTVVAGIPAGTPFYDTSTYTLYYWSGSAWTASGGMGASLEFEGATADDFETTVTITDPTADRTITVPNLSGTVLLGGTTQVLTGTNATLTVNLIDDDTTNTFLQFSDVGTPGNAILFSQTVNTPVLTLVATDGANTGSFNLGVAGVAVGADATEDQIALDPGPNTGGNEFDLTITTVDLTAAQTVTFPDSSGTPLLSSTANEVQGGNGVWANTGSFIFEGSTANGFETELDTVDSTADRTIYLPDNSGTVVLDTFHSFPLTADAVVQVGQTVMPDAGTASRFDVNTGNATGAIGVLAGTGASAQGTSYSIVFGGIGYVAIAEDQDVALGEYLAQSATAGYCNSAAIATIGLNIGRTLQAAPVTNTINHAGCTGGAGCVNTALDTPNTGPAGQITLAADVAAQGWAVGDPVVYWNSGGTSIAGLTDGATYFLVSVATTNVTLSATKGGAVIVPTTQGDDATQYLQRLPQAVIHVY